MIQKLFRSFSMLVVTMLIAAPVFVTALPAQALDEDDLWGDKDNIRTEAGDLTDKDPREIAAGVIKVIMGFLGIVAVVIILIGGFKWMTAGGNDEKITEAKKLITAGIIGLVIIIAAFAIASFIINSLLDITA